MRLTPIHIRRKRHTPVTKPPLALRGPPRKMRKSLATVLASRALKVRPTLESMPTEILESIFLYSLNVSLPRASHVIGVKLSNRATQLRLFTLAFGSTWSSFFGIPTSPTHQKPWKKGPQEKWKRVYGDYDLQSEMLELPWVNIDFILQAQQSWFNKHRDRHFHHSVPWEDDGEEIGHARSHLSGFDARECFEADYQQALKWPAFKEPLKDWTLKDLHPLIRIPTDLITGPWDDEKLRRLFWLFRGGVDMESEVRNQPPWEIKLECLRRAVLDATEPNALVVNLLVRGDWLFEGLPHDMARKELAEFQKRLDWGGDSPEQREIVSRTRTLLEDKLYPTGQRGF